LKLSVVVLPWTKETTSINSSYSVNVDQDGRFYIDPNLPYVTKSADYIQAETYEEGVTYYKKNNSTYIAADPQPTTSEEIASSGPYFKAIPTSYDYDVNVTENDVSGKVFIYAPEGGTLYVNPVGDVSDFFVSTKNPNESEETRTASIKNESPSWGMIQIWIKRRGTGSVTNQKYIKLSFVIEVKEGKDANGNDIIRTINADSEVVDEKYRFIIR